MNLKNLLVGVEFTDIKNYPAEQPFDPPIKYPEYKGRNINKNNQLYSRLRALLINLELDKKNINSPNWNPFGIFVKPGMKVFIKTNTVHYKHRDNKDIFSVIIHASMLRPILDYVCIALNGKGEIIIGDSQVYDADYEKALKVSGIKQLVEWYRTITSIPIECIDLRINKAVRTWLYGRWGRKEIKHDPKGYKFVDLGNESYFKDIDPKKLRIVIASHKNMEKHHSHGHHKYLFPGSLLESDVIINMPKLKTHRRTGITLAIKNFMGLPALKDTLPHFMVGSPEEGGDQYIHKSLRKKIGTWMHDKIQTSRFVPVKFFFALLKKLNWDSSKIIPFKDDVAEAMWPGNDTVWRTLLDLNKAAIYADKNGILQKEPQRNYFCILDGIIGGEGNGPLSPDPVHSGVVLAGYNPIAIDCTASTLMGFDIDKIRLLVRALEDKNREYALFFGTKDKIEVIDNGKKKKINSILKG